MRVFIRHYVTPLDESGLQQCLFCGATVLDNRGLMSPAGSPPSKGYEEGYVYISKGNPTITMDAEPENFITCEP